MADNEVLWKDRKRPFFGLPWSFTRYSLTDERIFIETGLFNLVENEVRLYRVLDVQLVRPFTQRIFGVGSIVVHSSDKSLGDFTIQKVKDPKRVKELLSELVEKERVAKRVGTREYFGDSDDDGDDEDED